MGGAGWRIGLGLAAVAVLLGGATGCELDTQAREVRLAELEAEGEQLEASFDKLEGRLLGGQASLLLWQELQWRHQQVSAVHCRHAHAHLEGIARHLNAQEQKARQLYQRRRLVTVDSVLLNTERTGAHRRREGRDSPRHRTPAPAKTGARSAEESQAAKPASDVAAESG